MPVVKEWSLTTGRGGGLQNGEFASPELFVSSPSRQGKTFGRAFGTPLGMGKIPVLKLPQNVFYPPSA